MSGHITEWRVSLQARGLADTTVREYVRCVTRCAAMTGTAADSLTTADIEGWLAAQPHLQQNSRFAYLRALRIWHRWLIATGVRDDDPTMRIGRIRARRTLPRPISTANLQRILAADLAPRTRAYVTLYAFAGLRCCEIARLRGEDIDLVDRTIRVRGKGDTDVVLPMHPAVAAVAVMFPRRGWWFPSWSPAGHVQPNAVSAHLSRTMHRLGVDATGHQLRHWYGTELLRLTGNVRVTQELMRHASLASTQIYTLVDDTQRREALLQLPNVA